MPTDVHFIGAEKPVRLAEDYDKVTAEFHAEREVGRFTQLVGGRVTIYKSGVAYIEEATEAEVRAYAES
jgi:hypothetical protein